jgi:hypothetical protein
MQPRSILHQAPRASIALEHSNSEALLKSLGNNCIKEWQCKPRSFSSSQPSQCHLKTALETYFIIPQPSPAVLELQSRPIRTGKRNRSLMTSHCLATIVRGSALGPNAGTESTLLSTNGTGMGYVTIRPLFNLRFHRR